MSKKLGGRSGPSKAGRKILALPVSGGMQNKLCMNMAIITDCALAEGWEPGGFERRQGFRVYHHKAFV